MKDQPGTGKLSFEARGVFEDKDGRQAEITTVYAFDPDQGLLEIFSTLTNTGQAALEETSFSLFMDTYGRFNFSPYEEERFPGLNFRIYQKAGYFLGWLSFNPVEKRISATPAGFCRATPPACGILFSPGHPAETRFPDL